MEVNKMALTVQRILTEYDLNKVIPKIDLPVASNNGKYLKVNVTGSEPTITFTYETPPNTNTTYSAADGGGLKLEGTAFSLDTNGISSGTLGRLQTDVYGRVVIIDNTQTTLKPSDYGIQLTAGTGITINEATGSAETGATIGLEPISPALEETTTLGRLTIDQYGRIKAISTATGLKPSAYGIKLTAGAGMTITEADITGATIKLKDVTGLSSTQSFGPITIDKQGRISAYTSANDTISKYGFKNEVWKIKDSSTVPTSETAFGATDDEKISTILRGKYSSSDSSDALYVVLNI